MRKLWNTLPITIAVVIVTTIITAIELKFPNLGVVNVFHAHGGHFGIGSFLSIFSHESKMHYIINMLWFIPLSTMLELKYGSEKMLFGLFISGIMTGLSCTLIIHNSIGLSGVVYLYLFMFCMMFNSYLGYALTILVATYYLIPEMIDVLRMGVDHVDHLTHFLNGVAGIIYGYMIKKK